MNLILKDGTEYQPDSDYMTELQILFPEVDLEQEFRKMRLWCLSNESRRKTRRGIKRFICNWISNKLDSIAHETHNRVYRKEKAQQIGDNIFGTGQPTIDSLDMGQINSQVWPSLDLSDSRFQGQPSHTGGMDAGPLSLPTGQGDVHRRSLVGSLPAQPSAAPASPQSTLFDIYPAPGKHG